jgi:hypothetical protein
MDAVMNTHLNQRHAKESAPALGAAPVTAEELQSRKNFKAPVDPRQHKLTEVLATYTFAKEVPCGLSTCKQGHLHGFLVRTDSGVETNVGHVCGKRNFGEDFVVANARFVRLQDEQETLARLRALKDLAASVSAQIAELVDRPFGLRWVRAVRNAVRARVGPDAYSHLVLRAQRGDFVVERVTERSEAEIKQVMDRARISREKARYKTEQLGRVDALRWLAVDYGEALFSGIGEPFKKVLALDPSADLKAIKQVMKPAQGWEQAMQGVIAGLAEVRKFFEPSNLDMADQAMLEHLKTRGGLGGFRALAAWTTSDQFTQLLAGSPDAIQALPQTPPKQVSKGQQRKNKRRGR